MQNKEQEILETAARLFQEKGFRATSIRDIASAAGVQKAAIYHYVTNKEELLRRIFAETAHELNVFFEQLLHTPMSNAHRLRRAISTYLTFIAGRGAAITVAFRDARSMSAEQRQWLGEISHNHMKMWDKIIHSGIVAGEFRPVDVRMVSFAIIGACSWVQSWYTPGGRMTAQDIADGFAELFVAGLAVNQTALGADRAAVQVLPTDHLAEWPVRMADVNPAGQLQISALVRDCQAALEDLFAACDWSYDRLRRERGLVPQVNRFNCKIAARAGMGDWFRLYVEDGTVSQQAVDLRFALRRVADGALLAATEITQEAIETGTGRTTLLPPDIVGVLLARLTPCGVKPG